MMFRMRLLYLLMTFMVVSECCVCLPPIFLPSLPLLNFGNNNCCGCNNGCSLAPIPPVQGCAETGQSTSPLFNGCGGGSDTSSVGYLPPSPSSPPSPPGYLLSPVIINGGGPSNQLSGAIPNSGLTPETENNNQGEIDPNGNFIGTIGNGNPVFQRFDSFGNPTGNNGNENQGFSPSGHGAVIPLYKSNRQQQVVPSSFPSSTGLGSNEHGVFHSHLPFAHPIDGSSPDSASPDYSEFPHPGNDLGYPDGLSDKQGENREPLLADHEATMPMMDSHEREKLRENTNSLTDLMGLNDDDDPTGRTSHGRGHGGKTSGDGTPYGRGHGTSDEWVPENMPDKHHGTPDNYPGGPEEYGAEQNPQHPNRQPGTSGNYPGGPDDYSAETGPRNPGMKHGKTGNYPGGPDNYSAETGPRNPGMKHGKTGNYPEGPEDYSSETNAKTPNGNEGGTYPDGNNGNSPHGNNGKGSNSPFGNRSPTEGGKPEGDEDTSVELDTGPLNNTIGTGTNYQGYKAAGENKEQPSTTTTVQPMPERAPLNMQYALPKTTTPYSPADIKPEIVYPAITPIDPPTTEEYQHPLKYMPEVTTSSVIVTTTEELKYPSIPTLSPISEVPPSKTATEYGEEPSEDLKYPSIPTIVPVQTTTASYEESKGKQDPPILDMSGYQGRVTSEAHLGMSAAPQHTMPPGYEQDGSLLPEATALPKIVPMKPNGSGYEPIPPAEVPATNEYSKPTGHSPGQVPHKDTVVTAVPIPSYGSDSQKTPVAPPSYGGNSETEVDPATEPPEEKTYDQVPTYKTLPSVVPTTSNGYQPSPPQEIPAKSEYGTPIGHSPGQAPTYDTPANALPTPSTGYEPTPPKKIPVTNDYSTPIGHSPGQAPPHNTPAPAVDIPSYGSDSQKVPANSPTYGEKSETEVDPATEPPEETTPAWYPEAYKSREEITREEYVAVTNSTTEGYSQEGTTKTSKPVEQVYGESSSTSKSEIYVAAATTPSPDDLVKAAYAEPAPTKNNGIYVDTAGTPSPDDLVRAAYAETPTTTKSPDEIVREAYAEPTTKSLDQQIREYEASTKSPDDQVKESYAEATTTLSPDDQVRQAYVEVTTTRRVPTSSVKPYTVPTTKHSDVVPVTNIISSGYDAVPQVPIVYPTMAELNRVDPSRKQAESLGYVRRLRMHRHRM